MAEFFGYEIKRKKEATGAKSFVAPSDEDGTLDIAGGAGFFSQYVNLDKAAKNDWDLIRKYRTTAEAPECDQAIDDIISESVTADETDISVKVNLDGVALSPCVPGVSGSSSLVFKYALSSSTSTLEFPVRTCLTVSSSFIVSSFLILL